MENKIKNIITLITVTSQEITINLQVLKVFLFCLSVQLSIKVYFWIGVEVFQVSVISLYLYL